MVPLSLLVVLLVFAPIALLIVLPLLQVLILDLVAVGEKIFKLEIGDFSNFSLLCDIDQAHGFDVQTLGFGILLILSITHLTTNFITANATTTCSNLSSWTLTVGIYNRPIRFS